MATTCSQCTRAFTPAQLIEGLCVECRPEAPKTFPPATIAAFVFAVIPFVFHASNTNTVNGEVVYYRDWIAIAVGGAGIAVAAFAMTKVLKARGTPLAMAGVALALCAFQLARGFGVV